MTAKSGLLVALVEVTEFDRILGNELTVIGGRSKWPAVIAGADLAIYELCSIGVRTKFLGNGLAQF